MGHLFRASELVELAILVEKNGEQFYNSLRESAPDETARDVFSYLAGEETKHIGTFQALLQPLEKHQPIETYPGEYEGYMKALADSHVFIRKNAGRSLAQQAATSHHAIEMAMRFEKDTILFFEAMRRFIPAVEHKTVDKLIDEERRHIVRLKELGEVLDREK